MLELLALPFGLIIGTIGSLTGVGGGFLLMPVLLLLFPEKSPASLTVISMIVIFFNALAGTVPSALKHRIGWKITMPYAMITVPMVVLGLVGQALVSADPFKRAFGVFMILSAIFLLWRQNKQKQSSGSVPVGMKGKLTGIGLGLLIGFISSFFGIGGGFMYVPMFVYLLHLPTRQATANSQLILIFVSMTSLITAAIHGNFRFDTHLTTLLVIGVVGGAQIGSAFAERVRARVVMRLLAVLMILASARLTFF